MNIRPRRNRKSEGIRDMVRETQVSLTDLIYPLFLVDGLDKKIEIKSMPGIFRWSLDNLLVEIEECVALGLNAFVLFPAVDDVHKDKELYIQFGQCTCSAKIL